VQGVSIVVCCYNSEKRLPQTLRYISQQIVMPNIPWEVIVINNASNDKTKDVAIEEWHNLGNVTSLVVHEQPIPGLSNAREKGIQVSKYNYILFCDDDNWLNPTYVQQGFSILSEYEDIGILGGVGEVISDVEIPAWYSSYCTYFATYPQASASGYLQSDTSAIYGAGMFVRKNAFIKLKDKGFNSILSDRNGESLASGGDYELCYAIRLVGYKLYYDSRLTFKHYMPSQRLGADYLVKLTSAIGYSSAQLILYVYVTRGIIINQFTWTKDLLYKFSYAFASLFNYYIFRNGSSIDLLVSYKSSLQQLKAIWHIRGSYHEYYRRIQRLAEA
jgi:glycosyltransferase involved in cell wall biosynthesis